MEGPAVATRQNWILTGVFAAALACSLYGITLNWTVPFMSGHEFRQAQTAIISYYIDQQDNFSLLYETPVLGKPWVSILLEVPVYEWSVVGLSRATGLSQLLAARTISAACFYLTLPAIFLLLGRFGLTWPRRLLLLALILVCPVYIYYSRAFLMDSMALMGSAWFLLGFVRTMDERRWSWLAVTIVAGTLAALVKSAILAAWLLPGAAYGGWMLWRDLRARKGWRAPLHTLLWGAATVVVPLGALRWWINYTDPIKAAHASAWIFTSRNLSEGNWGLFDFKSLFSAAVWHHLLEDWSQAVMPPWLIGLGLVAGAAWPRLRWRVAGIGGVFLLAQCMFPYAYAYQDYYFYACALFLNVGLGFLVLGVLDSRLPRWCCWLVLLVPFVAEVSTYWRGYRVAQSVRGRAGFAYDDVLREFTPKDSVIIVGGGDWGAMTPLYSQRKALMVRNGLDHDWAYLDRAFDDLAGENVSALLVGGPVRENRRFIDLAAARFDFDPSTPTFSERDTDVYIARQYLPLVLVRLKETRRFPELTVKAELPKKFPANVLFDIPPKEGAAFSIVSPAPYRAKFLYGTDWIDHGDRAVVSAHPDSDLWLKPPAGATTITWKYGIFSGAYETPGKVTNGVEFIIDGEMPDGRQRRIFYRVLDPGKNPADRGDQQSIVPYDPLPGESLRFSTRPNGNSAFDWAYWIQIKVK